MRHACAPVQRAQRPASDDVGCHEPAGNDKAALPRDGLRLDRRPGFSGQSFEAPAPLEVWASLGVTRAFHRWICWRPCGSLERRLIEPPCRQAGVSDATPTMKDMHHRSWRQRRSNPGLERPASAGRFLGVIEPDLCDTVQSNHGHKNDAISSRVEARMPIYLEISPLHRLATIVARGTLTSDEVNGMAQKLAEARVRRFAKVVEVAGAHMDLTPADIAQLAQTLRGDPGNRGPIAFVVAPKRGTFARQFAAATAHEGPVDVFHSLREARAWIATIQQRGPQAAVTLPANVETQLVEAQLQADPDRQGTVIRGERQRAFTTRELIG